MSEPAPDPRRMILIADDEPDIVALVAFLLRRAGHQVIGTADGDSALALAREHLPDLCVLDGRMPKLHGFQVLQELRDRNETATLPVMILTATVDEEREIRRHGIEPDAFIAKPFDSDELLAEVSRLLDK